VVTRQHAKDPLSVIEHVAAVIALAGFPADITRAAKLRLFGCNSGLLSRFIQKGVTAHRGDASKS
jgi:hypothetical protein